MAELATFATGRFSDVEACFQALLGVLATRISETGAEAEAVEIRFDPTKISYDRLLAVFFDSHDPTEVSRQGAGHRSAIFTHSPQQRAAAEAAKAVLDACQRFPRPIATEVVPAATFSGPAESGHQTHPEKREG